MRVVTAGVMYYLAMDSSLVEILNTTSLATYQPLFFYRDLLSAIIPHCLNSSAVLCLWRVQNIKYKIQGLSYSEQMIWSYARNMSPKSYSWKKLICSWMLWKTECKVLVWHKILFKRVLFCLCKTWVWKFGDLINRFGLEGGTCFKFFYRPKFSLCWVIYVFCLEQYWAKISLLFLDLTLRSTD